MIKIDIDASIEAGKSCAGIALGTRISDFQSGVSPSDVKVWVRDYSQQLAFSIKQCDSWLRVPLSEISEINEGGEIWHYGRGMIQLSFGKSGYLFDISVFDGYGGALLGSIRVGMSMPALEKICSLEYDESEEIYFPKEGGALSGVGFYIDESDEVASVHGISIFNLEYCG